MNDKDAFYFIAKSLSLGDCDEKREHLLQAIRSLQVDWGRVVLMASNHLVLQTLYVKYRDHNLLAELPKDLVAHLEMVYDLNVKRNNELIRLIKKINVVLMQHQIEPVFLKGSAYLLSGLYSDIGERIMLDIDFLVDPSCIQRAANCLKTIGYDTYRGKMYWDKSTKHYPRLTNPNEIVDIELHFAPVSGKFQQYIDYQSILPSRIAVKSEELLFVPDADDQLKIQFYHALFENKGYLRRRFTLRDLYDALLLSKTTNLLSFISLFSHRDKAEAYVAVLNKTLGLGGDSDEKKLSPKMERFVWIHDFFWKNPACWEVYLAIAERRWLDLIVTKLRIV